MLLPVHLAERVREWVDETPKTGLHVDNEAARYGGVSLMGTIGEVWLLRPDVTFHTVDDDSGMPLRALPSEFHTLALVAGSKRHSWLAELLPPRPSTAIDCLQCLGRGELAAGAYCQQCSALGWRGSGS
jgi:hypothetical protein